MRLKYYKHWCEGSDNVDNCVVLFIVICNMQQYNLLYMIVCFCYDNMRGYSKKSTLTFGYSHTPKRLKITDIWNRPKILLNILSAYWMPPKWPQCVFVVRFHGPNVPHNVPTYLLTQNTPDLATAASAHSQLQPLTVGTTLATRILTLRQ